MKTWNDYKEYVRTVDPETAKDIKETEEVAAIVTAMVEQRNALGLSQRELAAMCGLPQFRNIHMRPARPCAGRRKRPWSA